MNMLPSAPKILAFHYFHPDWTWQDIAAEVGCSREWVRVVMTAEGIWSVKSGKNPTVIAKRVCPACGEPKRSDVKHCRLCANTLRRVPRLTLTCEMCGIQFKRDKVEHEVWKRRGGKLVFHNNVCLGRYAGQHYGYAVHPENIVFGLLARQRKKGGDPQ